MSFELQPTLEDNIVKLVPLKEEDFEALFEVASDPLIWEQHPNKNRYQRDAFKIYFQGALESKGAFCIYDKVTNKLIGSSRFYAVKDQDDAIAVGYTFYARSHWGGVYNPAVKALMLEHAFKSFGRVLFQIGADNIRSQTAITRLGARKIGEESVAYFGEPAKLNFLYEITKA